MCRNQAKKNQEVKNISLLQRKYQENQESLAKLLYKVLGDWHWMQFSDAADGEIENKKSRVSAG